MMQASVTTRYKAMIIEALKTLHEFHSQEPVCKYAD